MHRRRLLAGLAAGLAALAGCHGDSGSNATTREPRTLSPTPTPLRRRIGDVDLPVPQGEIEYRLGQDDIPAITEPAFAADWAGLTVPEDSTYDGGPLLPADSPVIGVERDGRARAYPLRILDWHEVVNDGFAGPLLVTYCPLCGSGVTAERRVAGQPTIFGVSGRLWRNDLVLYDRRTESLWSQLLAAAIRGPRAGEQLTLVPSSLTTWGEWRESHPDTQVLLPPPESNTVRGPDATYDYFSPKYLRTDEQLIGYPGAEGEPEPGQPAERRFVVGIGADGVARAYPVDAVRAAGVVNDRVGDLPVVVTVTPGDSLVAYDRRVDDQVLDFAAADPAHLRAGGSRWERTSGRAVDGPFAGRRLARATDLPPMFWKGWRNFHPETTVYGRDGG
jgi:hypothetical protein